MRSSRVFVILAVALIAPASAGCVDDGYERAKDASEPPTTNVATTTVPEVSGDATQRLQRVLRGLDAEPAEPGDSGPQSRFSGAPDAQTMEAFMTAVLNEVNQFWSDAFAGAGRREEFHAPAFNWYYGSADAGPCGTATPQAGAFYCASPDGEDVIYVPVEWMVEEIYGPTNNGDFAVAAVLAHEYGHHLQHLIRVTNFDPPTYICCGLSSIHIELHADCLSGVWANSAYYKGQLDSTDLNEALTAESRAGDSVGTLPMDPGAHGQPQQRVDFFNYGYNTGNGADCDLAALR